MSEMQSWEIDHNLACRRGYHILHVPCEHYHKILADRSHLVLQHQQQLHQHPPQQPASDRIRALPAVDNLTSCTIRTPASGAKNAAQQQQQQQQQQLPQPQPRRRRAVDQAIYRRMQAILTEAGETPEPTAGYEDSEESSRPGEERPDEEETEEEDGENEEDFDEEEEEEEEEEEDPEDEATADTEAAAASTTGYADVADATTNATRISDGDQIASEAVDEVSDGAEIASNCGNSVDDRRERQRSLSGQRAVPDGVVGLRSRACTMMAASASLTDRGTGRSILKNGGNCRQSVFNGKTYSSEHYTEASARTDEQGSLFTPVDGDSAMSRMRARQCELTRCVLLEQKKEQLMRQRQEMHPRVKEAVQQMRRSALQGLLPKFQDQTPPEGQQEQQQLRAMHEQLDRWDTDVPTGLRVGDASTLPPPLVSEPNFGATSGYRRRVKLTGLSGLCRERRPFVAKSRDMQRRSGPPPNLGSFDIPCCSAVSYRPQTVTQRLCTTEAPYNVNNEEAKLFKRIFSRALDPSVLAAARAV